MSGKIAGEEPFLNIERSNEDKIMVSIKGNLTRNEVSQVYGRIKKDLKAAKAASIVVDLSELDSIDTAGVAMFVALCRNARRNKAEFWLENPNERTLRVIKLARLDRLLLKNAQDICKEVTT